MTPRHQQCLSIIRSHARGLPPQAASLDARLPTLPGIRAVVFDVYGTLIASGVGDISLSGKESRFQALCGALEALGWANAVSPGLDQRFIELIQIDHEASRKRGVSWPEVDIREIVRTLLNELAQESKIAYSPDEDEVACFALEYEMRANPVGPMTGLDQILTWLRERGVAVGIVSNAQFYTPLLFEALLERTLEDLGFDPRLRVWSFQQREAKPSVALYQECLDALERHYSLRPEEALYVGNDMRNDILPASKVGMRTALFAGDRRSLRLRKEDPSCADLRPDAVLTSLDQLPTLFPG